MTFHSSPDDDRPTMNEAIRDAADLTLDDFTPWSDADHDADFRETLGNCGCTDYHMADCPLRTGDSGIDADTIYSMDADQFDAYMDRDDWG